MRRIAKTQKVVSPIRVLILALSFASFLGVVRAPSAEAIIVNTTGIPTPYQNHTNSNLRRCLNPGDGVVYLHSQQSWISLAGQPTNISPVAIDYGTNSVDFQFNVLSSHCTKNLSTGEFSAPSGSSYILNRAIQRTRYNIVSGSASYGTVSGLPYYLDNAYSNTYQARPNEHWYVKSTTNAGSNPSAAGFTLSGLSSLAPGTYTINITITQRVVNRYHSDTTSGTHICVSHGTSTTSIDGPNCANSGAGASVQIIVRPPPVDEGTCTVTSTPRIIYPNTSFSAGFTVANTGEVNWATGARPQVSSYAGRYVLRSEEAANNTTWGKNTIELPGNVTYGAGGTAPYGPIMFPGDSHSFTESGFSTPSTPGVYVFSWSIRRLDQQSRIVSSNCRVTINVVERKPYWRVYGGDVYSGFGFVPPNGGSCPASAGGRFRGYNISLLGVRIGAGAQLAAYALNPNEGFSTASTRTSSPLPVKGLTFANNNNANVFGGDWDATNFNCAADYFDPDASVQADGYIVSGRTLALGQKQTIYVDGDAYISGNIQYPAYASLTQLPSFKLIVKGNIYVNPNVTEINGWFIAQPRYDNAGSMLPTTGRFYTCAITGRVNPVPTNAEIATLCDDKLTVYGAILAHTLKPIRSNGDLRSAVVREGYTSSNLAESLIFSPEVWLTGGGTNSGSYDSITALPPIL